MDMWVSSLVALVLAVLTGIAAWVRNNAAEIKDLHQENTDLRDRITKLEVITKLKVLGESCTK